MTLYKYLQINSEYIEILTDEPFKNQGCMSTSFKVSKARP